MNERKRILFASIATMATVSVIVGWIAILVLYRAGSRERIEWLQTLVREQVAQIEAVAPLDLIQDVHDQPGVRAALVSELIRAHERAGGFGETGELLFARRAGEGIDFLHKPRFHGPDDFETILHDPHLAEPMRLALAGKSGWIWARDYRGEMVLAAYAHVPALGLGLVAKIDRSELNAPFVRAAGVAGAAALVVILLGAMATLRISGPMLRRLEANEAHVRTVVETAAHAIITIDDSGRIDLFNRGAAQMFGYEPGEVLGQNVNILMPEAVRHQHDGYIRACVGSNRHVSLSGMREVVARRKDGTTIPCEFTLSEAQFGGRRIFTAIMNDISARKQVEERLRVQSSALDAAANGIVMTDPQGHITWANPAFSALTGYALEEVIGQNPRFLNSGRNAAGLFTDMWRTIASGCVWHGDLINQRKDGRCYAEEMTITPVTDKEGKITCYIAIKLDVSARKRAEVELQQQAFALSMSNDALILAKRTADDVNRTLEETVAELARTNEELARKNEELGEFSYVASHDLQEPIRKLISFAKLLHKDLGSDLPERAAKDLHFITDAATRMQTLVQDLLKLARAGNAAIERATVAVDDCVDDALASLSLRIEETGAEITRDALPTVVTDAALFTQVVYNLINNALTFVTTETRPVIRLTAVRGDGEWMLGVRDNGIGIKPEYATKIFAPFKRLHGRGEYSGTGIGLAICRKNVERLGGRIWVESELGCGAHFKFTMKDAPEGKTWPNESAALESSSLRTTISATRN